MSGVDRKVVLVWVFVGVGFLCGCCLPPPFTLVAVHLPQLAVANFEELGA